MSWIDAAGISLSVLAVLLLVWMIADARRLPGAGSPDAGRASAARWVWPAILVSSFLGGLFGVPIGGSPEIRREAAASSYQQPVDTRWSTLRTPFYLAVRKEERSARGASTLFMWQPFENVLKSPFPVPPNRYLLGRELPAGQSRRSMRFHRLDKRILLLPELIAYLVRISADLVSW